MEKAIEINGVKYPMHLGHRAMVEFERTQGKPFQQASGMEDAILILFVSLKSGAKSIDIEFPFTFEAFIDYVDAHPEVMAVQKKTA